MGFISSYDSDFGMKHPNAWWRVTSWYVSLISEKVKVVISVYDIQTINIRLHDPVKTYIYKFPLSDFAGCVDLASIESLLSQHPDFQSAQQYPNDMALILGCTDKKSSNYNPEANYDDGSCCQCDEEIEEIVDCAGVPNGEAYYDNCDQCVGGNTGLAPCEEDCTGKWGGLAELDECGVCNGPGIPDGDCDCDENVEDCSGECGGNAKLDECGNCYGGNTGNDPSKLDECGRCPEDEEYGTACEEVEEEISNTLGLNINADGGVDVMIITDKETSIGGFQFSITNFNISGVENSSGLAGDAGFHISTSKDTVLGFSFSGAIIPSTLTSTLLTLIRGEREGDSLPTLHTVLISNSAGSTIPFNILPTTNNGLPENNIES